MRRFGRVRFGWLLFSQRQGVAILSGTGTDHRGAGPLCRVAHTHRTSGRKRSSEPGAQPELSHWLGPGANPSRRACSQLAAGPGVDGDPSRPSARRARHSRVGGLPAEDRISRGQQKLLAAVLLLSQMRLLPLELGARPTLLLDDPAAELDAQRLGGLIRAVQAQPLQLIVTTLHEELAEFAEFGTPGRRYRMEQGDASAGLRIGLVDSVAERHVPRETLARLSRSAERDDSYRKRSMIASPGAMRRHRQGSCPPLPPSGASGPNMGSVSMRRFGIDARLAPRTTRSGRDGTLERARRADEAGAAGEEPSRQRRGPQRRKYLESGSVCWRYRTRLDADRKHFQQY